MGYHKKQKHRISRRSFLGGLGWAPLAFLPAPFSSLAPGRVSVPPLRSLGFTDSTITPHFPKNPPLEEIFRFVTPGTDQYVTEKYAAEIATILNAWGDALETDPSSVERIGKYFTASLRTRSLGGATEKSVRSASGLSVVRRVFPGASASSRDQFRTELAGYFSSLGKIRTSEMQIVSIEETEKSPLTVRTDVRYDFVGTSLQNAVEERIGYWRMEWTHRETEGWRVTAWLFAEETLSRTDAPAFVDVSSGALGHTDSYKAQLLHGVDYWRTVLDGASGIDIYGNTGVAAGDYDNDGFDDLYVCQPAGLPNRLYHNRGDGTFDDVTDRAGVGVLDGTACAIFADFENRGRQDLLVVCAGGPLLFQNQGNGTFSLKRDAFRFVHPPAGTFTHASVADYDGDGRLDIYFCLYSYYIGLDQYRYPVPYFDARNGPPNFLFHNEGNGIFQDRTEAAGLNAENDRYSFACTWNDVDSNGTPDLYVVNDFGRNSLYRNNGNGTFTAISAEAEINEPGAGMSACWLDYDNDGKQDIYAAGMWVAAGMRIFGQAQFQDKVPESIRALYERHMLGNSLYRNQGNGRFQNAARQAGVEMGRWSWSADAWDFDHDGYPDLYIANGYISGPGPRDVSSFFWRQVVANSPATAVPNERYEQGWNAINELIRSDASWNGSERNVFYRNNQDGTFSDVSGILRLDFLDDSRAFALADLDHDGRLEIVLKNRTGPQLRILHNSMKDLGSSLSFRLVGTKSNRDAIGAAVTLETGGRKQKKLLQSGSGFLSQHSKELFFGIGDRAEPLRASIRWPSGATQTFENLPANHRIEVQEGVAEFKAIAFASSSAAYQQVGAPFRPDPLPSRVETWLLQPLLAPDFSLPGLSGDSTRLSSLRGQVVLLNFWSSSDAASVSQLRRFEKSRLSLLSRGVRLLCVNLDDPQNPETVRSFAADEKFTLPIVLDTAEVAGIYDILYRYLFDRRRDLELPTSFLVDREGMVVKLYQGQLGPAEVLDDLALISTAPEDYRRNALPFKGSAYLTDFKRNDFTYGVALFQRGYLEAATEAFEHVIRSKPDNAEAYYNLGTLYLTRHLLADARNNLQQALKLRPEYAEAWNNLGMVSAEQGNESEAIEDFQKCLQFRPTYITALINYGNLLRRKGDFDGARKLLLRALEVNPDDPDATYSLGMLYARQNELQQASEYLEKAVRLRPDNADALNNLGVLLVRMQKYPAAKEKFELCIAVAPAFDQGYLNLARLYLLENEKEKAREVLKTLLRLHPEHKLAQQTLEMIN